MKSSFKNYWWVALVVFCCGLANQVSAQIFRTIHNFADGTNIDGGGPQANLILSGGNLYGTAVYGGAFGYGTVFKVNLDGTHFTALHGFAGFPGGDGDKPGGLVLSDSTLYGPTFSGGSSEDGTLFKVNSDGSVYVILHSFSAFGPNERPGYGYGTNQDGGYPWGTLKQADNVLYGTTTFGGAQGQGTVFKVNMDGSGFTSLYSFTSALGGAFPTNNDGVGPGGLVLANQTLYGVTGSGGTLGGGTVFKLNTDGTGFEVIHSFTAIPSYPPYTNSEGASPGPDGGLLLSGNTLYGTTLFGGSSGNGTLFKLSTDGASFAVLHAFTTNGDGAAPRGLILSGNSLYGTTSDGGTFGFGTVFKLDTSGTGFQLLHSFTPLPRYPPNTPPYPSTNADGAFPKAGVILSGNVLYGTTTSGGSAGSGTIFSISLPVPQLSIATSAGNVILAWPTNYAGFDYSGYKPQSSTDLISGNWTTNLPAPVVVDGQYTATNPISGTQQFFRLSQ